MKILRISELMALENKITERVRNDGTKNELPRMSEIVTLLNGVHFNI